jgi:hypothetical protein
LAVIRPLNHAIFAETRVNEEGPSLAVIRPLNTRLH